MPPGLALKVGDIKEPIVERVHDIVSEATILVSVGGVGTDPKGCQHAGLHFTCCELADAW
jgi:hypothetical protein